MDGRMDKLVAALGADFEAALVCTEVNRFYLLDFASHDAGTLLILPQRRVFIIDSRYYEAACEQVTQAELVLESDAAAQLGAMLKEAGVKRLCLEDGITVGKLAQLQKDLPEVEMIADSTLSKQIARLRAIKQPEEIRRMRRAQQITDACFEHILPYIKEGVREIDIMLEMEYFMRANGAENVAFDTICVAGAKSSLPHGVPGDNRIKPGDFITMDFGAKFEGYCSDMTRTVALGEVSDEQRAVYELVLAAHLAGIEAARPGVRGCDVDAVARGMIYAAGYEGYFGHGLGHAVGIEVHEEPRFSPKCADEICAGMMMTVEPGVYLPGRFGCRIEDTVLITEAGCEPLPASRKDLIVL